MLSIVDVVPCLVGVVSKVKNWSIGQKREWRCEHDEKSRAHPALFVSNETRGFITFSGRGSTSVLMKKRKFLTCGTDQRIAIRPSSDGQRLRKVRVVRAGVLLRKFANIRGRPLAAERQS